MTNLSPLVQLSPILHSQSCLIPNPQSPHPALCHIPYTNLTTTPLASFLFKTGDNFLPIFTQKLSPLIFPPKPSCLLPCGLQPSPTESSHRESILLYTRLGFALLLIGLAFCPQSCSKFQSPPARYGWLCRRLPPIPPILFKTRRNAPSLWALPNPFPMAPRPFPRPNEPA